MPLHSETDAAAHALLRQAMLEYPGDPARGDFLIRYAFSQAADPLPLYRIGYKFYNRMRRFKAARDLAAEARLEAARRARLPADPAQWTRKQMEKLDAGLASHLLLALKASAFIALRMNETGHARVWLEQLTRLDPQDGSGASVIEALMSETE